MDYDIFLESFFKISKGIPATILLVLITSILGLAFAILVNVGRKYKYIRSIVQLYVVLFTGTPLFLQLFFVYFGVGGLVNSCTIIGDGFLGFLFKNAYVYALITLALNTGAYSSTIIKSSLEVIPEGQIEAAKALGLTKWQTFRRIILPQAFFYALPGYSNEIILLVKASSLTSMITIMDITGYMKGVISNRYSFYEPFLIATIYYLIINYSIIALVKIIEKRSNLWLNKTPVEI